MCGILAALNSPEQIEVLRPRLIALAKRLRHRGPDWSGVHIQKIERAGGALLHGLAHERLAIVDPEGGAQPLLSEDGRLALAVNGEIYNHVALRDGLRDPHSFKTRSDCEVILHLYEEHGADFIDDLDGVFAFVLCDKDTGEFIAARDPLGVVPLYWGWGPDGATWFASEMKALCEVCQRFEPFPPGHVFARGELRPYARPAWHDSSSLPCGQPSDADLLSAFEQAVVKRMMSDVPYGVLLSGGLDSSLVASVVSRHTERRMEDDFQSRAWWPRLHSFCIGLANGPDLAKARKVADFLGTAHHELHFTLQEGLDALREVIYHTETYDVTTIRASTPMFLMARKIKAMGVKMVLTGEGADEVFGGYLYFHKAPNPREFHEESVRKVRALHHYDCLRANKSMAAWGVEARVPFLDKAFLEVAMGMDPARKMIDPAAGRMEKHALRQAFDSPETPYLPDEILWRQKEQFSDGVGYGWIDGLRAHAETRVSDAMFASREHRFPLKTPQTKEGFLYRMIFEELFPQQAAIESAHTEPSIACSTQVALRWDESWQSRADPSGRAVGSHQAAYEKKADA